MHPHGVLYQKNSEGSGYNDGTSVRSTEDIGADVLGTLSIPRPPQTVRY